MCSGFVDRHDRYRYLVDTNLLQDLNHIAQPSAGPLTSVAGAYILKEFMKARFNDPIMRHTFVLTHSTAAHNRLDGR